MATPYRKRFPKNREFFLNHGLLLTHAQIADYARTQPSIKNDVLRYDSTDTYVRDYMLFTVVSDVLGKGYDWPCNANDPEWTNLFYEKFFLAAHAKGLKVDKHVLKLAQNGTFRKRAEAYREATRFK